jgi:glycerophosphoryl diester phosphodiesterase
MNAHEIIAAMYDGQALVFGHRGAKAYAPMNTIPAFELAMQQGAHGVELDVHRSKDGYPVILHDFEIDETTNGSGHITAMTLAELKALDAGSWFSAAYAGVQIPTLDEVFEAVGRQIFVNVEIKSESVETDGVEQVVADCIRRHNMQQRVLLSSFNPMTLMRFRALLPAVPVGFLFEEEYVFEARSAMNDSGFTYEAYHPHHPLIDEALVAAHKAAGRIINTWTVNDPQRAVELVKLGVSGIITDNPDTVLAALLG